MQMKFCDISLQSFAGQSFEILCQDIFFLSIKYDKGTLYKFGYVH